MKKSSVVRQLNIVPPGFLERHRFGSDDEFVYLPLAVGFLRLFYDIERVPPLLERASFVAVPSPHAPAIGEQLELDLGSRDEDTTATFIAPEGVSGIQWSGGRVAWGHTYEDGPRPKGEKVSLSQWIDHCVQEMIHPPPEMLARIKKRYDPARDMNAVRAGDEDARERFWKRCAPASEEEAALVLRLLRHGVIKGDGDLLFCCADPLKRATAGTGRILTAVTAIIEKGMVTADEDRSELYEVLEAHAALADGRLARRWLRLCEKALGAKGPESLHAINEGSLYAALSRVKEARGDLADFFDRVVHAVENAPPAVRDEVRGLQSFRAVKKLASDIRGAAR